MNANDNISRMLEEARKESRSEYDANLALIRERDRQREDGLNATLADMFRPMKQDKHGFWK